MSAQGTQVGQFGQAARPARLIGVDELKRAWYAVQAGEFRNNSGDMSVHGRPGLGAARGPRGRGVAAEKDWSPADGEHAIAVLGCAGSAGASTLALAVGLAATTPVRVIECCSVTASGLAAASTAELGLHASDWRQGKRDHVLLERASEVLAGADEVPLPTDNPHRREKADGRAEEQSAGYGRQLTILDIGWEAGQLLATDCWLAEAVRTADQVVLVTTATVPGMRRAGIVMELLVNHWQPEDLHLAVRGPRRKKWPRGLEHAGGPAVRRALDADRCVEIPEDRDLAVNGLDSRTIPAALISASRQLLEPADLLTDSPSATSETA
ncbi:hypothetical protein [Janibacter sp. G1551]|uniref:hypothetical protein n=1 Tax=Janibacter sp. G1551 TaxID=3420440 RepID=UPI003D06936E